MSSQGQTQTKTITVFTKELDPWVPDIDPRRSEKPQITDGTNFIDDLDGPRSAFSSNLVNFNFWDGTTRQKVNELSIRPYGILYGTNTGVWSINPVSGAAEPVLQINVVNTFWPWTIAYVGGLWYIAQYDIGLWQYDPVDNTIAHITAPFGDVVRGVAESQGRLIGLTDVDIFISALDDGTNLTPSLTTAAGEEPISIAGGIGLKIEPIPDGFLVYTSNGMIKGTYVTQPWVFEYKSLKSGVKVWSPNATVYVPRLGALSLDNTGFNLTREFNYQDYGTPQPWEITMGDYIKKNILNTLDQSQIGSVLMYYSEVEQKLFVMFSSNVQQGIFLNGFVYTLNNKKWGSFDHQCTGIFETYNPTNNIYTLSYLATDGYMRACTTSNMSQDLPPAPYVMADYVYRAELEESVIAEVNDAGTIYQVCITDINGSDNNPFWYSNFSATTNLYYINYTPYSDTANDSQDDPAMIIGATIVVGTYINMDVSGAVEMFAIPYQLPSIGINSILAVGAFRFTDQNWSDEISAISGVLLGLTGAAGFELNIDWNTQSGTQDWNTMSGTIDWGAGNQAPDAFTLTLRSSNDLFNAGIQGDEVLPVWDNQGSTLMYSPEGFSGLYHVLTLSATDPGEAFALKTIDVTGLATGRMSNL